MPPATRAARHAPASRALPLSLPPLALALAASALGAQPADGDGRAPSYPERCGSSAPPAEAVGYVAIPAGDVWCPLLADPKAQRSYVAYQRGSATEFAQDIASVGIADQFGLFRFGGPRAGDGVQVSLAGGVYAQFDLGTSSYDLINADYVIGLPVTFRRGGFSGRVRVYHQSSHLGDEFLLRAQRPDRENLSFESAELLLSQDVGVLRVYGGGEVLFNREPETLGRSLAHGGVELRPRATTRFGNAGSVRFVAALDVKSVAEQDWRTAWSGRAGLEVGRARDDAPWSRRWSLLGEVYDGPSPYGQFFDSDVRLVGVGFHFAL
jgi:hypothetical protein